MNSLSPYSLADIHRPAKAIGAALQSAGNLVDKGKAMIAEHRQAESGPRARIEVSKDFAQALVHGLDRGVDAVKTSIDHVRANPESAIALAAFAAERAAQAHHRIASAPPALPGAPAAQAPENLPDFSHIRAAYTALIRLT